MRDEDRRRAERRGFTLGEQVAAARLDGIAAEDALRKCHNPNCDELLDPSAIAIYCTGACAWHDA